MRERILPRYTIHRHISRNRVALYESVSAAGVSEVFPKRDYSPFFARMAEYGRIRRVGVFSPDLPDLSLKKAWKQHRRIDGEDPPAHLLQPAGLDAGVLSKRESTGTDATIERIKVGDLYSTV